ncbi:zeta toxin family protein [Candidatus Saccharibacteria bacterium]|nr:zeta toxin family protein [Candidatus Saccharibacteria bacterium]
MSETLPLQDYAEPPDTTSAEFADVKPTVPVEFVETTRKLEGSTDLAEREQLKAEAAQTLSPFLELLQPDQVGDFLDQVNHEYAGVFAGQDLCLLSSSRENVIIVSPEGRLEELAITPENAKDVLRSIKGVDKETMQGHSYALRHEIMKRSEGKIVTDQAYTYDEVGPSDDLDSYLADPEHWIPERRAIQEQIINDEYARARELSGRLHDNEPTVYALRGNTAAGKTTAVKKNPSFAKALDSSGEPTGSINPDTYKTILKSIEAERGTEVISHHQAHEEGSMIAKKIMEKIAADESSLVIDKRMSKTKNLTELSKLAEASGKEVKILDVDIPLEISLVRVLERPIGGEAPNVPFGAIAEGYVDIRNSRNDIITLVEQDPKITEYVLMVADETGQSVEVAKKTADGLEIHPDQEALFRQSMDTSGLSETVENLAQTEITDEYIENYIEKVFADDTTSKYAQSARAALTPYRGMTLKQALDKRAGLLNESEGA